MQRTNFKRRTGGFSVVDVGIMLALVAGVFTSMLGLANANLIHRQAELNLAIELNRDQFTVGLADAAEPEERSDPSVERQVSRQAVSDIDCDCSTLHQHPR